ncbi:hypothetical protein ACFQ34_32725 [Pseudonocardia benzenivorans]|uniref:Uncharacterized protein n=1 Tax=Pseudonocardia benzenivorans TaxID=228005 RepID=A0ABW3VSS3_9PSEU
MAGVVGAGGASTTGTDVTAGTCGAFGDDACTGALSTVVGAVAVNDGDFSPPPEVATAMTMIRTAAPATNHGHFLRAFLGGSC